MILTIHAVRRGLGIPAPNVGYATVYPMATVLKVLLAQALVSLH